MAPTVLIFVVVLASLPANAQRFQGDPTHRTCNPNHDEYNLCEYERVIALTRLQTVQLSARQPLKEFHAFACEPAMKSYDTCARAAQKYYDTIASLIADSNRRALEAADREAAARRSDERFRQLMKDTRR